MSKRNTTDWALLASELLCALRGKRSRPGFSRHLGYRSNVAQRWESGACAPTAARFFEACQRLRLDVGACLESFLRQRPRWLDVQPFDTAAAVAALLTEMGGRTPLSVIATRSRFNRYSVSRWFKGAAMPKLPELLCLLDACSGRVLDFVEAFVDPALLPSFARPWRQLKLRRELAYSHPLSHAVLRALELGEAPGSGHDERQLSERLGIAPEVVAESLLRLADSGQVRRTRRGWVAREVGVVDTGADRERTRALKLSWAKLALQRLEAGGPGYSGYGLFSISKLDLVRLHELQLAYIREMQSIVAASKPGECVALYCTQFMDLSSGDDNVFASSRGRQAAGRARRANG